MKRLFIIPARGGSKGLPGKNIKELQGRPLLHYSLEYARLFSSDKDICITTDDDTIAGAAASAGYQIPFKRPALLSGEGAGMREVLLHALDSYEKSNGPYEALVLLQPTSPFRQKKFLEEAWELFNPGIDMVVSVNESKANPYFNLFEENEQGYLQISKPSSAITRQAAPEVYQYNGNFYIINTRSLRLYDSLSLFPKIRKYIIPAAYGTDIDTPADWNHAEYLIKNHLVETDGKL